MNIDGNVLHRANTILNKEIERQSGNIHAAALMLIASLLNSNDNAIDCMCEECKGVDDGKDLSVPPGIQPGPEKV